MCKLVIGEKLYAQKLLNLNWNQKIICRYTKSENIEYEFPSPWQNISIRQVPRHKGLGIRQVFAEAAAFRLPSCRIQHRYQYRIRRQNGATLIRFHFKVNFCIVLGLWIFNFYSEFLCFIGIQISNLAIRGLIQYKDAKMQSYRKFHCGDKTILWLSYFHNGISFAGNTAYLYIRK